MIYEKLHLFIYKKEHCYKSLYLSAALVLISLLIFIYSIFVGLSRVYVGVHYLSDVLAGWAAGLMWVTLSVNYIKLSKDEQHNEATLADQRERK